MEQASLALDKNQEYFLMRLNEIARERENEERQEQFNRALKDRLTSPQFKTQPKMFPETLLKTSIIEDDDQSILDQHVSRVFSPHLSPGTASPRQLQRHQQHRNNEMSTSMPDFGKKRFNFSHQNSKIRSIKHFCSSSSNASFEINTRACIIRNGGGNNQKISI